MKLTDKGDVSYGSRTLLPAEVRVADFRRRAAERLMQETVDQRYALTEINCAST